MTTLLATFGYCVVSALLPFVNAEVYLLGIAALTRPPNIWLLAGTAAVGQMIGKIPYYYAGRGALSLPRVLRREPKPGRWSARFERWRTKAEDRPLFAAGLLLLSAFVGLPPFAAVVVLAGVVRVPLWLFLATGIAGRYARFACLLALPGVWRYLSHGL